MLMKKPWFVDEDEGWDEDSKTEAVLAGWSIKCPNGHDAQVDMVCLFEYGVYHAAHCDKCKVVESLWGLDG